MTGSAKPKATIEVRHVLSEAVKEGRAVVVFGAGASIECRSTDGSRPPSADELRDHWALTFLGIHGSYGLIDRKALRDGVRLDETRNLATMIERGGKLDFHNIKA